jgi:cytochrome c oxidase assembly protein subunit 15
VILVILFFQLIYGALMAGHKAANVAATWPDINGDLIPPGMFRGSWLEAAVGNRITVQFIHRTLAYLLFVLVLVWTIKAVRLRVATASFRSFRWLPLLLISFQIILGISSLLTSPWIRAHHWVAFDWLAQLHQITGLLFLLTMVGNLYLVMPVRRSLGV